MVEGFLKEISLPIHISFITDAAHYRNIEAGLLVRSPIVAGQAARLFEPLAASEFCVRLV